MQSLHPSFTSRRPPDAGRCYNPLGRKAESPAPNPCPHTGHDRAAKLADAWTRWLPRLKVHPLPPPAPCSSTPFLFLCPELVLSPKNSPCLGTLNLLFLMSTVQEGLLSGRILETLAWISPFEGTAQTSDAKVTCLRPPLPSLHSVNPSREPVPPQPPLRTSECQCMTGLSREHHDWLGKHL